MRVFLCAPPEVLYSRCTGEVYALGSWLFWQRYALALSRAICREALNWNASVLRGVRWGEASEYAFQQIRWPATRGAQLVSEDGHHEAGTMVERTKPVHKISART
jgi:hypothetical protein